MPEDDDKQESLATRFGANLENVLETTLFGARWLLAPLYLGLIVSLLVVVYRFFEVLAHMVSQLGDTEIRHTTITVLETLDITLLGNLILLVMFVGYENFVSHIDPAQGADRPHWLGRVNFSGLKLKMIASLVAISVIELLKDFLADPGSGYPYEGWRIGLHMTFVASGLIFAITDWIAAKAEEAEYVTEKETEAA